MKLSITTVLLVAVVSGLAVSAHAQAPSLRDLAALRARVREAAGDLSRVGIVLEAPEGGQRSALLAIAYLNKARIDHIEDLVRISEMLGDEGGNEPIDAMIVTRREELVRLIDVDLSEADDILASAEDTALMTEGDRLREALVDFRNMLDPEGAPGMPTRESDSAEADASEDEVIRSEIYVPRVRDAGTARPGGYEVRTGERQIYRQRTHQPRTYNPQPRR
jgi:hypothetical protein